MDTLTKTLYSRAAEKFGLCDSHYVEKLFEQGDCLPQKDRVEFWRKVGLLTSWANLWKQESVILSLHREIAGFVNDKTLQVQERVAPVVEE